MIATAALAVALPALAQDDEGDNVTRIFSMVEKAGHGAKFGDGIKAYWQCYKENGGIWSWSAWRPESRTLNYVMFRSGGHVWADFDAENPAGRACGEIFREQVAILVDEMNAGFSLTTLARTDGEDPNVVQQIALDFTDAGLAMDLVKAFHETMEANEKGNYVWLRPVTSSGGWDMSVALLNRNFAEMAPDSSDFWQMQAKHHGEGKE